MLEGRVAGLEPGALRHLAVELPLGTGSCDDCYGYDREGQRMDLESLEDLPEGDWLVVDRQSAGRGRQGRAWNDGAGNFMGSTVIRPRAPISWRSPGSSSRRWIRSQMP